MKTSSYGLLINHNKPRHTVFYDNLPHYFLEFDVLDLETQQFLSTDARRTLLRGLPIVSVPVLFEGIIQDYQQLLDCLGNSNYITETHEERFEAICREKGLDVAMARQQTNLKPLMEGLYIKVEREERHQNRSRQAQVPETVLDRMTKKLLEIPNLTEAHQIIWKVDSEKDVKPLPKLEVKI